MNTLTMLLGLTDYIQNFFATIFQGNTILAIILIAMVPIIELRGAIPFAMESAIWGASALSNWNAMLYSLIGSCLVVPFVALAFEPIIRWLKKTKLFKNMALAIEEKVQKHSSKMMNKQSMDTSSKRKAYWLKMIGVFAFVAVPLPLTGVWTGTAVAVVIGLDFWSTCLSVMSGNLIAGLLITLLSSMFDNASTIILIAFAVIIACIILYAIVKIIIRKIKGNKNKENLEEKGENNHQTNEKEELSLEENTSEMVEPETVKVEQVQSKKKTTQQNRTTVDSKKTK